MVASMIDDKVARRVSRTGWPFTSRDLGRAMVAAWEAAHPVWGGDDRPDSNGRWWWHASELSKCPRELILTRAGLATDPPALESELTMLVGLCVHRAAESAWETLAELLPGSIEPVAIEQRFRSTSLPLTATPDAVLRSADGKVLLVDLKTEHERAAQRRSHDALASGARTKARPEHQVQVAAQALCLKENGIQVDRAAIIYLSRNNLWCSEPWETEVPLDRWLMTDVIRRVERLEELWARWEANGELPPPLPEGSWQCQAQAGSEKGRWCRARSICMARR